MIKTLLKVENKKNKNITVHYLRQYYIFYWHVYECNVGKIFGKRKDI